MTEGSVDRNSCRFYSQHGEDFLLSKLFADKANGFFVEVGCIDGRRFSNTLYFEELGWSGLCIEAHSDYIHLLSKNRPHSIVEHAAVGERNEDGVEFFANARGTFSTLDESKRDEFAANFEHYVEFEIQNVPLRTLNSIFAKHGVQDIDLLSLDIEGHEVLALKGLDLTVFRPKVFVIESESALHRAQIERILLTAGYHFIAALSENLFYSLDERHRDIIGSRLFRDVQIVHTRHPLDPGGDEHMTVDISTIRKRRWSILKRIICSVVLFGKSPSPRASQSG